MESSPVKKLDMSQILSHPLLKKDRPMPLKAHEVNIFHHNNSTTAQLPIQTLREPKEIRQSATIRLLEQQLQIQHHKQQAEVQPQINKQQVQSPVKEQENQDDLLGLRRDSLKMSLRTRRAHHELASPKPKVQLANFSISPYRDRYKSC